MTALRNFLPSLGEASDPDTWLSFVCPLYQGKQYFKVLLHLGGQAAELLCLVVAKHLVPFHVADPQPALKRVRNCGGDSERYVSVN